MTWSDAARAAALAARRAHMKPKSASVPTVWAYHATNRENMRGIAKSSLVTHGPSYGTDQRTWPDGKASRRSYFSLDQKVVASFAPAGKMRVLRVAVTKGKFFREKGTGDIYSRKAIGANKLQVLGPTGIWHRLKK